MIKPAREVKEECQTDSFIQRKLVFWRTFMKLIVFSGMPKEMNKLGFFLNRKKKKKMKVERNDFSNYKIGV